MRNVFLRAQQMTAEISGEKVVCRGAENASLAVGGETFRVLYAEGKSGICGALYVRAVLEKEEKDDGNGA